MSENNNGSPNADRNEKYSLNDDRRVKVLSPGALVAKRFFRNRLAVTGMIVLLIMFLFSFLGGIISPYKQDQKFYREDVQVKDYAGVKHNEEFVYTVSDPDLFKGPVQAQTLLNITRGNESFDYGGNTYTLEKVTDDLYMVYVGGQLVGMANKELVNASGAGQSFSFDFTREALLAKAKGDNTFQSDGAEYTIDDEGVIFDSSGAEVGYVSDYIIRPIMSDVFFSRDFKLKLIDAVEAKETSFTYNDPEKGTFEYILSYDAAKNMWNV